MAAVARLVMLFAVFAGRAGPVEILVRDVNDHGVRHTYRGHPLLESVPAGTGDQILLHCSDGFTSLLPVELVKRWNPILATEVETDGGWTALPPDRAPAYLVWPNVAHPEIDADRVINPEGWAWAVTGVERSSDRGLFAARAKATPAFERGRAVWIRACFHCHALDGVGGMVSWDLASPTPLWSYQSDAAVRAYVADPKAVDPAAKMSPQHLTPQETNELMAFLHDQIPAGAPAVGR